jgi:hypothetical protein
MIVGTSIYRQRDLMSSGIDLMTGEQNKMPFFFTNYSSGLYVIKFIFMVFYQFELY